MQSFIVLFSGPLLLIFLLIFFVAITKKRPTDARDARLSTKLWLWEQNKKNYSDDWDKES